MALKWWKVLMETRFRYFAIVGISLFLHMRVLNAKVSIDDFRGLSNVVTKVLEGERDVVENSGTSGRIVSAGRGLSPSGGQGGLGAAVVKVEEQKKAEITQVFNSFLSNVTNGAVSADGRKLSAANPGPANNPPGTTNNTNVSGTSIGPPQTASKFEGNKATSTKVFDSPPETSPDLPLTQTGSGSGSGSSPFNAADFPILGKALASVDNFLKGKSSAPEPSSTPSPLRPSPAAPAPAVFQPPLMASAPAPAESTYVPPSFSTAFQAPTPAPPLVAANTSAPSSTSIAGRSIASTPTPPPTVTPPKPVTGTPVAGSGSATPPVGAGGGTGTPAGPAGTSGGKTTGSTQRSCKDVADSLSGKISCDQLAEPDGRYECQLVSNSGLATSAIDELKTSCGFTITTGFCNGVRRDPKMRCIHIQVPGRIKASPGLDLLRSSRTTEGPEQTHPSGSPSSSPNSSNRH